MKQILVVEDDEDIREALKELLSDEGLETLLAANGQEAIDYLRGAIQLPDVILLDMMMPVKNGQQFRSEQMADERLRQIPVIVMTAKQEMDTSKMDAAGVIKKPITIPSLLTLIKNTKRG
jgi:CheY-like chemotaxis protein